ncbi:hypothetical protein PENTCL1PPCAC_16317, partial [Pristionchus entomophagus]
MYCRKELEWGTFIDRIRVLARKTVDLSSAVMEMMIQWVHISTGGRISDINTYYYVIDHPQLPHRLTFIYSKADVMCREAPSRAFHQHLSDKRNKEMDAIHFSESPHVQHFMVYPVRYIEGIERML